MSENKPKVLYVVQRFSGGILSYLVDLTGSLINDYQFIIAYSNNGETPQNIRSYFDKSVQMYQIAALSNSTILSDSTAKDQLQELVKEVKPDLIHFHGYGAGRTGRAALDGCGIPMFYTPHGYLFLAENHNRLSRSMFRRSEASSAKTSCMTIACSKGEFAETLALTENATYINNGINTKVIDGWLGGEQVPEHSLTVYTTGIINPQKNAGLFNEIAAAMPDTKFVWIGDGEQRYKLTSANIEITGWLPREEALRRANQCDVFVLTSLWEGLPISLLEAMYMKKLAIVSNVVGSRDVIENGQNGYICDTAAAFVNAINHVRDKSSAEIIQNAYDDIIEHYTVKKMAKSYDNIYKRALQKKTAETTES